MDTELFNKLTTEDKWIEKIANPTSCYDRYHNFVHYCTCSYPAKYIVTEEQIKQAKKLHIIRKAEILASISKGELVFRTMGGNFKSQFEEGVGNYRIRCNFKNNAGHKYFIELTASVNKEHTFFVNFSIDVDLQEVREKEEKLAFEHRRKLNGRWFIDVKQDCYNCFGVENKFQNAPFTFSNILKFINKTYGCTYRSARLIKHLVSYEEWCCECL